MAESLNKESLKETILNTIDDMVNDFITSDRKEDEELPSGAIEQAVIDEVISIDEIVATFRECLEYWVEPAGIERASDGRGLRE